MLEGEGKRIDVDRRREKDRWMECLDVCIFLIGRMGRGNEAIDGGEEGRKQIDGRLDGEGEEKAERGKE